MLRNKPAVLFLLILSGDVFSLLAKQSQAHFWLKPLLIPLLIWLLFSKVKNVLKLPVGLITAALAFSWGGDVFLLFEQVNPNFFLLGLACFLITHILYIAFFLRISGSKHPWMGNGFSGMDFLIILYGFGLLYAFWPVLGDLKIPVVVYACCICTMALSCMHCRKLLPAEIWKWLAAGALLFVVSDSILAANKFLTTTAIAPPLVMLTYGLAQLFIVSGAAKLYPATVHEGSVPVE